MYAEDERGAVSEPLQGFCFSRQLASESSCHLSPADGSDVFGDGAILVWSAAEDQDHRGAYIVEYCWARYVPFRSPDGDLFQPWGQSRRARTENEAIDEDGIIAGPTNTWSFQIFATNQGNTAAGEKVKAADVASLRTRVMAQVSFYFGSWCFSAGDVGWIALTC